MGHEARGRGSGAEGTARLSLRAVPRGTPRQVQELGFSLLAWNRRKLVASPKGTD